MPRKKNKILATGILVISVYALCSSFSGFNKTKTIDETPVPYPEGYRLWTHIKTAVVEPANPAFPRFGGIHHIYANKMALEGYQTGRYRDGAIIVFDVFEAIDTSALLLEGRRRQIDVMVRDSVKYAATGGWGFEEFSRDSKTERTVKETATTTCFSCHASVKNLVFSRWRP